MTQNRKTFGMTPAQIGILAGLAGIACLLFGLAGWFALRTKFNPFARAPQNTPIPQSTATPFIIPTLTLTGTPTPVPYEMLIPDGWLQFKTGLVEIWLPKEFKLGDPKLFTNSSNSASRELIMTGVTSKSSLYRMLAMISYDSLTGDSLDAYLDAMITKLPAEIRLTERRKVSVNSMDAVRLVLETRSKNVDLSDLAYVFLDGSTVWYVEYAAQINEFYEMLSTFEQSVKTFRVLR
ncbi:MAG TPA: hypothetical protein VK206_22400 [Anaerolineales bacterium]|nr:hypothetical protein [Anaerolineales bacterium]